MNVNTRTIFEIIIFFRCLWFLSDGLKKKTLKMLSNYKAGTLIDLCMQRLLKASMELCSKSPFTDISKSMASYMLFDNSFYQFRVLAARFGGPVLLSQQNTLVYVGSQLKVEESMDTATFDCSASNDDVPRFVT